MSEITKAIAARQAQITQLQSDIETLQHAANVLGGGASSQPAAKPGPKRKRRKKATAAKAVGQPKAKAKAKAGPKTASKQKRKRPTWSAADKAAISKRMKAYWAKRRKAKG